jgi:YVTN family beta-propeller protein
VTTAAPAHIAAALLAGTSLLALGCDGARAQTAPLVYVPIFNSNTVWAIDTSTNVPFGAPFPAGVNPYAVAVSGDQSFAYVTGYGTNTVTLINTATNAVVTTIPVGVSPRGAP